ncbi:DsbA family protein [Sphingomonas nostoxanthinifaciens]|nr:DsbA family protein [Sphingomonas nostoxanthinifaciens]
MGFAALAGAALGAAGARAAEQAPDRAALESVIHDYILAHPEIIPQAMERLRARETADAIAANRVAIETPFAGAWAGNPKGDVTLVMFTDYSCGYCRASAPDIDRLLAEDPKLRVVWREIPVLGPQSEVAARLALAAAKQDRYPAFHRAVFAGGRADDPHLAAAGRQAGLDTGRATADRGGADIQHEIDTNIALAQRLSVSGTPAFVIGDHMLSGAVGHDALAQAIAAARKS